MIIDLIVATLGNKLMTCFSKYKLIRKIGVKLHEIKNWNSFWTGCRKLYLESYFEMSFAIMLSGIAFYEEKDTQLFFSTKTNFVSSSLFILWSIFFLVFPIRGLYIVHTKFPLLGN